MQEDKLEENKEEQTEEKIKMTIQPADALIQDDKDNIISKYIEPDPTCICCNTPGLAIRINKAYLDGLTYDEIAEKYGDEVEKKYDRKLTSGTLSNHFSSHFNFKGAAIAEYNRKHGLNKLPLAERKDMQTVFDALVGQRINDLELLDLAMKEQIKRMQELEDIKKQRIEQKRTHNIDQLIMKQEMIMNNLQMQILSKLKIWQKAQFQSKQMEVMDRQLQFLDHKTANFLGLEQGAYALEPGLAQEAEHMYLKVVIENLIKRVRSSLISTMNPDTSQTAQFFKELNREFRGIEKSIDSEFREKIRELKNINKK